MGDLHADGKPASTRKSRGDGHGLRAKKKIIDALDSHEVGPEDSLAGTKSLIVNQDNRVQIEQGDDATAQVAGRDQQATAVRAGSEEKTPSRTRPPWYVEGAAGLAFLIAIALVVLGVTEIIPWLVVIPLAPVFAGMSIVALWKGRQ